VTEEELVSIYPRLWHMAEDGSWPSIADNGLLSTSALLDLYGVSGKSRARSRHREGQNLSQYLELDCPTLSYATKSL
jgi:hypothetical protein